MVRPYSRCFACGSRPLLPFYEQRGAPAATTLQTSRAEALRVPRCNIRLAFCPGCGVIQDVIPQSLPETAAFACTLPDAYHQFARTLARRYEMAGKTVTNLGDREDALSDALVREGAAQVEHAGLVHTAWRSGSFSNTGIVTCLGGLDRVGDPGAFMSALRRNLGANHEPVVVFEAADTRRSLSDLAFWEIRAGRRSYFTIGSLARLFRRHEFDIFDLRRSCDNSRITLDAVASMGISDAAWPEEEDIEEIRLLVGFFRDNYAARTVRWNQALEAAATPVLWGAGPDQVAFLCNMEAAGRVPFAVDPDSHHTGRYMPVTGTEVVLPAALREARPDLIVTLNRRHEADARECLALFGLSAEVLTPYEQPGSASSSGISTNAPTPMPFSSNQPWFTSRP